MYVKSVFTTSVLFSGATDFEFIVVSVKCNTLSVTKPDFVVALFYRSPDSTIFLIAWIPYLILFVT